MRTLRTALVLGVAGAVLSTPALSCSFMPDERPWATIIADEPVVFVGTVADIADAKGLCDSQPQAAKGKVQPIDLCNPGDGQKGLAVFLVELPIRGIDTPTHVVSQGDGADCGIGYTPGERWLFAGTFIGGPSQLLGTVSEAELDAITDKARAAIR